MRRLRSSTVEPVIGTLVNFTAMGKVYTKGIKLANKCVIMSAVAYNLKKLLRASTTKVKKRVAEVIKDSVGKLSHDSSYWNTFILPIFYKNVFDRA